MFELQMDIIKKLEEDPSNKIMEFADILGEVVRYELHVKGQEIIYPYSATVRALLKKNILVRNIDNPLIINLVPPKYCSDLSSCPHRGKKQAISEFVSVANGGQLCKLCAFCRERKRKSKHEVKTPRNPETEVEFYPLAHGISHHLTKKLFMRWAREIFGEIDKIPIIKL